MIFTNNFIIDHTTVDKDHTKRQHIYDLQMSHKQFKGSKLLKNNHFNEEDIFHVIVESSPNAIVVTDDRGKIILFNSQAEKIFGYNRKEIINQPVEVLVPGRSSEDHRKFQRGFFDNPQTRPMGVGRDLFAVRKDGSEFPVEIGLTTLNTDNGTFVLSSVIDISERKLIELELREEKDRAQKYLNVAEVILLAINEKEEVELINQKGCKVLGVEEQEIIGENWFDNFLPSRIREGVRLVFLKLIAGEIEAVEYYENEILTKSGDERLIAWRNTVLTDGTGKIKCTLSSGIDITDQRLSDQALRESEKKLHAIMDNTTDAVLVYDKEGGVITINKEGEHFFLGNRKRKLKSIWEIIPSEQEMSFSQKLDSVRRGNRLVDYEMEKVLADGQRISVSVSLVYIPEEGGRFIETIRDIRERIITRNKMVELEKAQLIGKMAEGIAHHMGTPLASMLLRVQMLKEDMKSDFDYSSFKEKLDSVEKQIFYGQKVMQRLLRFSSKPQDEKRTVRVSTVIDESIEMIKPLLRRARIEILSDVDKDVEISADINLLELVFSDILMNAVDSMPDGGNISVNFSIKDNPQDYICIEISDTGAGIPRDILPLVFEPFFTTKPAGKGTGLGLSVAKRIIQDHDGEIRIESTVKSGTSVFINLPIYNEENGIE